MKDLTQITKTFNRLIAQIEQMSPNQHHKLSEQLAVISSNSLRSLNAVVAPAIQLAEKNEDRLATLERERAEKEANLKQTVLDTIKNSELSELLKQSGESSTAEDLLMQLFNTKPASTSKRRTSKKTSKSAPKTASPTSSAPEPTFETQEVNSSISTGSTDGQTSFTPMIQIK